MTQHTPALRGRRVPVRFGVLAGVAIALLSATACIPVIRSFYIPSESMRPTLQVNDRLFANMNAYWDADPQRGDVVLFDPPEAIKQTNPGFEGPIISRIVGLPGETLEVKDGLLYINDQPIREDYISEPMEYAWGPVDIPPKSYVVLGDNRNNAYDSHFWGFLPQSQIRGKAIRIYWPPDRMGVIE